LAELVSIPSVSGNEHDVANYLASRLSELGFATEKVETPGCGPTILARFDYSKLGSCLLLYGHTDTVEPTAGWRYSPFKPTIRGCRLYGLGAYDMKGGIAAILGAAERLSMMELKGSLLIALGSDEELYSRGCDALIRRGGLRGVDAAISAEPTELDVVEGRRGRVVYEVTVRGLSSHGAYAEEGVNAVDEAARFVSCLKRLPLGRFRGVKGSVAILSMSGGTEFLSVPDSCRMLVDRLLAPGETKEEVLRQMQKLVTDLNSKAEFRVKLMRRRTPFMEPYMLGRRSGILKTVEKAHRIVCGSKPRICVGLSTSDDNYLAVRGKIPTVSIGPRGGRAHAPDEYIDLPSVVDSAKIYAVATAIYLNTETERD